MAVYRIPWLVRMASAVAALPASARSCLWSTVLPVAVPRSCSGSSSARPGGWPMTGFRRSKLLQATRVP